MPRASSRRQAVPTPVDGAETGSWAPEVRGLARAAALSGILFAALFVTALVLVRQGPGIAVPDRVYAAFYTVGQGNLLVTAGLYVVPFAGIAYLWHMGATRTLVEALPGTNPEVPRWLQLASGILFVCMLFAGTAAVAAVALLTRLSSTPLPPPDVARTLTSVGYGMVFVFGTRAAGMYMITTTTLSRRRGMLPKWVGVLSYLAAAFLLVNTTFHPATLLVFPGWVVLFSAVLLVNASARSTPAPATLPTPRTAPDPTAGSPLSSVRSAHEHDDRA